MTGVSIIPLIFVVGIVLATIGLGLYATRLSRTTSDFYVAGRGVNAFWNSSAISGEYLSAASFMGIAGMLMKFGYDVLWYAVGYAAGYVFLLLFIAGPLRRFGAYTIPDFAEGRFDSKNMRKLAVVFALAISFFYMMPQMKGAGITLAQLLSTPTNQVPYWIGVVVVGTVITANVILGGMKGITFVQAFQYWVKQFAIMVPIFILMAVFGSYGAQVQAGGELKSNLENPAMVIKEDVVKKYPQAGEIKFTSDGKIAPQADVKAKVFPADPLKPAVATPLTANQTYDFKKGEKVVFADPVKVKVFAGQSIPNVVAGEKWLHPYGPFTSKFAGPQYAKTPWEKEYIPVIYTYSLIIALLCGTAGLPHILVRFYTNPDGRSAKKTTLLVIVMLSLFYIFPAMWAATGRNVIPSLYINGGTDLVTILLPTKLASPLFGQILSGITSAGAFAAFMTTFSGLLVSVSGGFAHDIYGRILRPNASPSSRLVAFKVAAAASGALAMGLGLLVENFDINMLVGWAFAIGASTYFPLLLLGAWFRPLTKAGAVAGMLGGGAAAIGSVVFTMLVDKGLATGSSNGIIMTMLTQPAIWTVPLALLLMVGVSLATPGMVPADIRDKMLKLHAPETLGLKADYIKD
jgi:Na+(H+)/acetate symporter ActP